MRRLIFVDDEPRILAGLERLLRARRREWHMRFASDAAQALAFLDDSPADVIVTDMRMPVVDGATLLGIIARQSPGVVRIVLSGQTDVSAAERAVGVAHQFLSKPCDAALLYATIEGVCRLRELLGNAELRDAVGAVQALPGILASYGALQEALEGTPPDAGRVAAAVARDPGLSAKVLQLANSSFFAPARDVSSIPDAVKRIDLGALQRFVSAPEVARTILGDDERFQAAVAAWGAHAALTAAIARRIAPAELADEAFAAGLLHDVGKLILATRPQVARPVEAVSAARHPEGDDLHAEVGAYQLGLWGLPTAIVAAVAQHHHPSGTADGDGRLVAIIHVADGLVHEIAPPPGEAHGHPVIDEDWLQHVELLCRLPEWRDAADEAAREHASTPR